MTKFLACTFLYCIALALSISVMIYGWGIKPVSWWWIIGVGVIGRIVVELTLAIQKQGKP